MSMSVHENESELLRLSLLDYLHRLLCWFSQGDGRKNGASEMEYRVVRAAHSNLAEPESTSPIFMLKFLIIWSLLEGVKVIIHQSAIILFWNQTL